MAGLATGIYSPWKSSWKSARWVGSSNFTTAREGIFRDPYSIHRVRKERAGWLQAIDAPLWSRRQAGHKERSRDRQHRRREQERRRLEAGGSAGCETGLSRRGARLSAAAARC